MAGLAGLSGDGKQVAPAVLVLDGIGGGGFTVLNCVRENVINVIREGRKGPREGADGAAGLRPLDVLRPVVRARALARLGGVGRRVDRHVGQQAVQATAQSSS